MNFIKIIIVSFTALFLFVSCEKEHLCDCFKSTGKNDKIKKNLSEFNEIEVNDMFNVYITQDTTNTIIIEGGKNLIPYIDTEISNNRLVIQNKNKCNWVRSYKKELNIYIHAKTPDFIYLKGESNIYSTNTINADSINIDVRAGASKVDLDINSRASSIVVHAGTGDFTLRGNTKNNFIYSNGNSYIFTDNLECNYSFLSNTSTGDCYVNVSGELYVGKISHGNVYYKGNPSKVTVKEYLSTGKVINLEE